MFLVGIPGGSRIILASSSGDILKSFVSGGGDTVAGWGGTLGGVR